jgi:outer membrane protein assembly factor BamB
MMKFRPSLPDPTTPPPGDAYWASRAKSRIAVAAVGGLWVILALLAAYCTPLEIPASAPAKPEAAKEEATAPAKAETAAAYPDWDTMRKNWPSFRGPGGYGVAAFTTAPTDWDGESGRNIKWKIEIPLPGSNSPVVWDKQIYLSGATEEKREVYCFDIETGQNVWTRTLDKLPGTPEKPLKIGEETGYAPSTMAVQGTSVMAIFANGDLVCYDPDGNLKWGKNLGVPENHYGHSSSLLAYQNLLFVQYDQKKNSKLFAFDISDGREVWVANREKISWASPVCVQTSFGPQLVLNSEKDVDAYDPLTGAQVWKQTCLDGEVAPSPAYGGGMFFVANDYATATAIRFNAEEKTPKPEIAWQWDEALPDVSSPVGTDTHFYVTTSRGQIACLDAKTGAVAWIQEYDEGYYASPIVVGDRIYSVDKAGMTQIFKTGATYELIGAPKFGEETFATPAFMDGRIYVRTVKTLLCVAN